MFKLESTEQNSIPICNTIQFGTKKKLSSAIHNYFFSMHTFSPPPIDLTWQKLKILYLK